MSSWETSSTVFRSTSSAVVRYDQPCDHQFGQPLQVCGLDFADLTQLAGFDTCLPMEERE
jgi:hypothetical protein